jgi:hypothetical protein
MPRSNAGYPQAGGGFRKRNAAAGDYLLNASADRPGKQRGIVSDPEYSPAIPEATNEPPIPVSGATRQPKGYPVGKGVKAPPDFTNLTGKARMPNGAKPIIDSSLVTDPGAYRRAEIERVLQWGNKPRKHAKNGLGDGDATGDRYPMGDGPLGTNVHYLDQEFEGTGGTDGLEMDFKDVVKHARKAPDEIAPGKRPTQGWPPRPGQRGGGEFNWAGKGKVPNEGKDPGPKYADPAEQALYEEQGFTEYQRSGNKVRNARKLHILSYEDLERMEALFV